MQRIAKQDNANNALQSSAMKAGARRFSTVCPPAHETCLQMQSFTPRLTSIVHVYLYRALFGTDACEEPVAWTQGLDLVM